MKGKIMAVAAVLVMVFAAVGVVMPQAGDSDADTTATDLGFMIVASGTDATKTLATTEGQFTGYTYTLSVYMAEVGSATSIESVSYSTAAYSMTVNADGTASTPFSGTAFTKDSQFSLAMARDASQVGGYKLTATYVGAMTAAVPMAIKIVITPTVYTEKTDEQTLYYTVTVAQEGLSFGGSMGLNAITVTGGTYYSKQVEATIGATTYSTSSDASGYRWYATNLPEGLAMSATGYISGIATDTNYTGSAVVTAVDKTTGAYYTGSLSITYTAYTESSLSLKVSTGTTYVESSGITDGNLVVKTSSTAQDIAFQVADGATNVKYTVYAVDSNGKFTTILNASDSATASLDISGSGAYRVIVTATGTVSESAVEETVSFYLYVMPVFENVSAHISVSTS